MTSEMSGDAFLLTAHDARAQEFTRQLRGYDPLQVEAFRERVAEALERLHRDRSLVEERLRAMTEQLAQYQQRERALNDALVAAQQLRAETRDLAEREAEAVRAGARVEAERMLDEARRAADGLQQEALLEERLTHERTEQAARQFQSYVSAARAMLERQLADIAVLQGHVARVPPAPGTAAAAQDRRTARRMPATPPAPATPRASAAPGPVAPHGDAPAAPHAEDAPAPVAGADLFALGGEEPEAR